MFGFSNTWRKPASCRLHALWFRALWLQLVLSIGLLIGFSPEAKAQPAGYGYGRGITVQSSQVSGSDSLIDFPLYVELQGSDLRDTANGGFICNANGYDIHFTLPDCSTALDLEIEDYDNSTGTLKAWVRIPALYADSNTQLYLFYGNASVTTDPSSASTWEDDYVGVWHMAEDPSGSGSPLEDHSPFVHDADATGYSSDARTSGIAGQAITLDGSTQSFSVDSSGLTPAALAFSGQDQISISAWVKFDGLTNQKSIVELAHGTNNEDMPYWLGHDGTAMQIRLSTGAPATGARYSGSSTLSTGVWYHMAYTYDGSTLKGFLNGSEEISVARTGNLSYTSADGFRMGKRFDTRRLAGTMDEVRISRVARSQAWMQTQYNNISNPSSFYTAAAYTTAETLCSVGITEPSMPALSCYTARLSFSIDNSQVAGSSNLTDFPALVVLQHDTLKSTANGGVMENLDGWDMTFVAADESTELDFEVEHYDADSGLVVAWVKVPTLFHNIDTELFCYLGCAESNMDPSTSATWSNGYVAVWHMSEASNVTGEALEDHSNKGSDGTPRGFSSDAREAGVIEDGIRLNGSSEYFNAVDGSATPSPLLFVDSTAITLSGWINLDAFSGEKSILEKSQGTSDNQIRYFLGMSGSNLQLRLHTASASGRYTGSTAMTVGKDHYIALTYDGTSLLGFLDGSEEISEARSGAIQHNASDEFRIGKRFDGRYIDGLLDELRVAHVARSADWVETEYNNQSDPSAFIGSITAGPNPLPVSLLFFEGASREAQVDLLWATAAEMNSASFSVERSSNGEYWKTIAEVQAAGTSTRRHDYRSVDRNPLDGQSYYRLLQKDRDGSQRAIGLFALWREGDLAPEWKLYPNPLQGSNVTVLGLDPNASYRVSVLESSGRLIGTWPLEGQTLSLPELRSGVYAVRIMDGRNGEAQTMHLLVP